MDCCTRPLDYSRKRKCFGIFIIKYRIINVPYSPISFSCCSSRMCSLTSLPYNSAPEQNATFPFPSDDDASHCCSKRDDDVPPILLIMALPTCLTWFVDFVNHTLVLSCLPSSQPARKDATSNNKMTQF